MTPALRGRVALRQREARAGGADQGRGPRLRGARSSRQRGGAPGPVLTDNLVAAAVTWLCSDQAAFITGATLRLDGGKLAGTPPFQVRLKTG